MELRLCVLCCLVSVAMSFERKLLRQVIRNYKCDECLVARPVEREPETMSVEFGIALIQVVELDEKRQTVTTHMWEYHTWWDTRLAWNPEQFGNMSSINAPYDRVWTPSISLYNLIDKTRPYEHPIHVLHTGEVLWVPQAIYKSPCDVRNANFPFDEHVCNFTFASWTYNRDEFNLSFYKNQEKILKMNYYDNPQWEIHDISMERVLHLYQCCPEPFVHLVYSFTLRRRVAFFAFVLILPSVLLSVLTLVVFCLPPDSTDKINIGLSIFLSYFVLLMILVESTPTSGATIPLLGQYFCVSLVIIAFSVFSSTLILNLYGRRSTDRRMSKRQRRVVETLASLCLVSWVRRENYSIRYKEAMRERDGWAEADTPLPDDGDLMVDTTDNGDCALPPPPPPPSRGVAITHTFPDHRGGGHRANGPACCRDNKRAPATGDSSSRRGAAVTSDPHTEEWMLLASLLDRVFFLVYLVINVAAASAIFTRAIPSNQ